MTVALKRVGLKAGAALLAVGMACGLASAQNTNGDAQPFRGGAGRGRGPGGPGGPGMMGFLPMAAVQLDLSDTQKAQIQGIAQSHADEWKTLVDRQQQARRALDASINAAQFDEVLIRQHSAELAAIDADAAVARARARGEVVQLLTPDQQAKLKTLESRATAREGGPGRRGPRA